MMDWLYHYTTASGLTGIVRDKVLWATCIRHLNDSRELAFATDALERVVAQEVRTGSLQGEEKAHLEELVDAARSLHSVHIHVFCLSEQGDQLSQWRAYAPNGGYAMRFDAGQLAESLSRMGFSLKQCVYEESEYAALLRPLIQRALHSRRTGTPLGGRRAPRDTETWLSTFEAQLLRLAPQIKHPGFKEEAEWRAISPPIAEDDKRCGEHLKGALIVPHFKIDISQPWPIVGVRVGPMPHQRLASEGVGRLFHRCGVKHGDLGTSGVPYRPL